MKSTFEFNDDELTNITNEFKRLKDCTYLDHAGATLYSEKQIDNACDMLKENLYSNPHTSQTTEDLIDNVRYKILKFFNTDITEYDLIFTSGTTQSLKLIAENFHFNENGYFSYVQENHTSVLGMREIVKTDKIYVLTKNQLLKNLNEYEQKYQQNGNNQMNIKNSKGNNLIVYPAQCNFSGYKYSLELIKIIQKFGLIIHGRNIIGNGDDNDDVDDKNNNDIFIENELDNDYNNNENYVCLDAASFVGTNYLDLKKFSPDFVTISFYKIFGYPTGLGALLVNRRGQNVLKKSYYGGGTVKIAMSLVNFHEKRDTFHECYEDGTISFLSIINLLSGFNTIEKLIPIKFGKNSMERISNYVFELSRYCYNLLIELRYNNSKSLVKIYSHTEYTSPSSQGGIISFNLMHDDGSYVGFGEVACLSSIYNIHLRTGCFCNPGACQVFLNLENSDLKRHYQAGHICGDYNDLIDGIPTGAVRISFGYMSKKDDIDKLINMIKECYLKDSNFKRYEIIEKSDLTKKQFHNVYERLKNSTKFQTICLREICIYPIKSCGPFKTKFKWELNENGLKYDRCWMIINSSGLAVTQKAISKLCLITPIIDENKNTMKIMYPGFRSIEIPLDNSDKRSISSLLCQSKVCGDLIEGYDCGDEVAEWLCTIFSTIGLRLIQQRNDCERKSRSGQVKNINLSNQAQFLLINYTSVAWLASKVNDWTEDNKNNLEDPKHLDSIVDRFRGNLIIETNEPMEENNFNQINFGEIQCKVDGPCNRCQMICIDPRTGQKTTEPLRTITKEFQGKIRFGIYLSQKQHEYHQSKRFISCNDKIIVDKFKN